MFSPQRSEGEVNSGGGVPTPSPPLSPPSLQQALEEALGLFALGGL
jgi:hypothetical protein